MLGCFFSFSPEAKQKAGGEKQQERAAKEEGEEKTEREERPIFPTMSLKFGPVEVQF